MKYLVYFKPNEELSDLILNQENIILPGSGLHSTILVFYTDGNFPDLSQISFKPFEIETLGFEDFDKDSLVLKLSCSRELLHLHNQIVEVVENYPGAKFNPRYVRENYNPHFTISRSSSEFDRSCKKLIGQKDFINNYALARKVNDGWEKIGYFSD